MRWSMSGGVHAWRAGEREEALARDERPVGAGEPLDADARQTVRHANERLVPEAGRAEPAPDPRGQVRRAAMTGPDQRGAKRAHAWKRADGPTDVRVADVAEYPAHQDEVRRHRALVPRGQAGVAHEDLDAVEAGSADGVARPAGELRVELDETATHPICRTKGRDRLDQVATLATAQAQHADRRGAALLERARDLRPNDL